MTGTTLNIFDLHSKNVLSSIIVASECATSPIVSDGYKIAIGLAGDIILVEEMKTKVNLKLSPRCECEENAPRSLLFMDSNILVCGDSYGTVTFWNLDDFTLIQSIPCLFSSILSMVTTADGLLYVCGEDPRLTKIGQSSTGQFEILERKAGPVEAVRSMATSGNTVYDKSIYVSQDDEYSKVAFHQMNFYDQYETELLLANAGDNFIDIYYKIKNDEDEYSSKRCFDYEFSQKTKTPLLRTISCWDISNNSQFLVMSTSHETVFYEREKDKNNDKFIELTRLDLTVTAMSMTTDSKLLAARPNLEILKFSLSNPETKGELFFDLKRSGVHDCQIVQFQISSCVSKIAFLTSRRKFFMTNIQNLDLRKSEIAYPIHVGILFRSVFHVILTKVTDKSEDSTVENEYEFYEKAVQELKKREFEETHHNLVRSVKFALTRTWLELGLKITSYDAEERIVEFMKKMPISAEIPTDDGDDVSGCLKGGWNCTGGDSLFYEELSGRHEDDWDYVFRNTKLFLHAINLLREDHTFKGTALKDALVSSDVKVAKQDTEMVDFGGKQYSINYTVS